MATLKDFNVTAGEVVIVEGTVAKTSLLSAQPTGGKFSQDARFVRLVNAKVVDASKGPNLAKFVESHIGQDEPHWYTATSKLDNIQVIDQSTGKPIQLQNELAREQTIRIAVNAFQPKNFPNLGSGLQAVSVPSEATLVYVGQNQSAAALFGIDAIAQAAPTAQAATIAEPAAPVAPQPQQVAPAAAPMPEANPFAGGVTENNPFA